MRETIFSLLIILISCGIGAILMAIALYPRICK